MSNETEINKGRVRIKKFIGAVGVGAHELQYVVEHNNGETTVNQLLTIKGHGSSTGREWVASIDIDGLPDMPSPEAAALKLADWLERLASAMRVGEYFPFSDNEFKDINPPNHNR